MKGHLTSSSKLVKSKDKARIKVPVCVELDDGTVAARFSGDFIALKRLREKTGA